MGAGFLDGAGFNVPQYGNLKQTQEYQVNVCMPGFIWWKWGDQAYKRWATGEGGKFRERKRIGVSCTEYGGTM